MYNMYVVVYIHVDRTILLFQKVCYIFSNVLVKLVSGFLDITLYVAYLK